MPSFPRSPPSYPDASPSREEVERQVALAFEETLGVHPVLRNDDFYALGGTSLAACEIGERLQSQGYAASARIVLVAGTVAALAGEIAHSLGEPWDPTPPAAPVGLATAGQGDLWGASTLGSPQSGSQISRILWAQGTVPANERWQRAWSRLVERHAALRTALFEDDEGRVSFRTLEAAEAVPVAQLALDECRTLAEARGRIAARCNDRLLLTEAPLARAGLMRVAEGAGETLLWFTAHQAVVDGLSARILEEELHVLLSGGVLPPARSGIAQASSAERSYLGSDQSGRDRAFWLDRLYALATAGGGEAFHELATDHRRPERQGEAAAALLVERLDGGTVAALARLAREQHAGLHAVLLALLGVEARRRVGRRSVVIGSGVSVRPPGAGRSVGQFVNLVPVGLVGSFVSLAAEVRAAQVALTEALAHGAYPSSLVDREFRQRHPHVRLSSRMGLFDISLSAGVVGACRGAGLSLVPCRLPGELGHPGAGLDLDFGYAPAEDAEGLELTLSWNPDVYRRATAQAWLGSLAAWARWLAEDAGRANEERPALLPEEEERLARWERGPLRPRPAKRFHELFEGLADEHPERVAVVTDRGVQRYGELERRANRVARALLDQGVAREEPVAVLTECSADLPATVLGIWKAGAAYLPLALEQPAGRLAFMAQDSGARTLVVLDGSAVPLPLAEAVGTILRPEVLGDGAVAERPAIAGTPRDLAYIIYTSGTSGTPKGVLIQHDGLVNASYGTREIFGLTPEDRFSLVATPGFDASLWELGAALLNGMAVVPVSRNLRDDPWALKRWYTARGVTVAFHAPSYLRVTRQVPFEGLRVLLTGGEAPNHDDVRDYAHRLAFWNAYGPTETCIFVCAERLWPETDAGRPLSVGPPNPNTHISIRREGGDRVPPGVPGEVWLGGVGLARGYLNNPELSAKKFVETPEGRFYRSGDLGRFTEEGRLELSGRMDDQIKWHGQRVELGEIEHALRSHPAVEEAVALVDASAKGSPALRAFVRLRPTSVPPTEAEWRGALDDRLPAHMIPATVTTVPSIPLSLSGKVDREALLRAPRERGGEGPKRPPEGGLEVQIAELWCELLQVDGVSREDNFFALGGNSLLAITMTHRLSRELGWTIPARELFAAPTLVGFAGRAGTLVSTPLPVLGAQALPARSDLATCGQREFWVAEAAGLDTRTFTIPVLRLVEGDPPPLERWNAAWWELVARHEALRTSFHEDGLGRLVRRAAPVLAKSLETAVRPDDPTARTFIRERQEAPFAMSEAPLWRAGLVGVADSGQTLFWLALHHSVGDGQSVGVLLEDLGALLRGEARPPLSCDFAESAAREEGYLAGPACAEDGCYWADLLARQPGSAFEEGPLDFPRSTAGTGAHRFETVLDPATTRGLRALARRHEATLHAVMLTLLALEARRRTGREEVLVGSTASSRETAQEAQVVGYYVNMLPLPCRVARTSSFGAALRETQGALAAGMEHARYPFARMYHDFWSAHPRPRHPARYPLFDLVVTENPQARAVPGSPRLSRAAAPAEWNAGEGSYELTRASPGQDVVLTYEALADGGLILQVQANAALYTRETASGWFEALRGWAGWLAGDPGRAEVSLPALLPHEGTVLGALEQGGRVTRPDLRFHELFEKVLDDGGAVQADRPAVITRKGTKSYRELEREANCVARGLLVRGVAPGAVVGVLCERSARLPAAVLGIWKAGGTYLPLAAELPPERLAFMAKDAKAALLVALDGLEVPPALLHDLPPPLRPEELYQALPPGDTQRPPPSRGPGDAAYIIYTSGSTGQPKGALVGHQAYLNAVLSAGEILGLGRDDRCLMFSSPSFDVSLSDLGLPLAFGAALCPLTLEVLSSPSRFLALLLELHITVADLTPTYLRLLEGAALPSLRVLVTGGEAPIPADVRNYAARLTYFNAYGPTENTITSTMGRLAAGEGAVRTIGRPLPNTSLEIRDREGNRVPLGTIGELWLGGLGLAHGYLNRPDLTRAAFVETPRGRRYRSGDLGRWRANGEIELLGRVDDQVKLNGIRIELGEIEHALAGHPDVAQAVALLAGDAEHGHSLWGFVRPAAGREAPGEGHWRGYLASRLPAYMIPSAVVAVPDLPVSASGKVDRAALIRLVDGRSLLGGRAAPLDGLETEIARVWSDLLGLGSARAVHRDDDFFALGGHSLLAIAVAERLEKWLGHPVPARELFAEPTLRGFARRVGELGRLALPEEVSSTRATLGQRDFWIAEQAGLDTRSSILALALVARGAVPPDAQWRRVWAALTARHEALRTRFQEDRDGVLQRLVLPSLQADLEVATRPDLPAALVHARERQADPFRLERAPLWRAGLVRIAGQGQPLFWLALHHAVGDGVSLGVLVEELSALLAGRALPAEADRLDRSAGREERYLTGPACAEDARYWGEVLGNLNAGAKGTPSPFDEWPLDFARPIARTERNARGAHCFHLRLDAATAVGLRELARRCGAGLHALFLALVAEEVRRRTGRSTFLLGTAASTRESAGEARTVGCYVNMLPVACRVGGGEPFEEAVKTMQRGLAEALQHGRYPFGRIVQDFRQAQGQGRAPHPARHPLFDVAVTENPSARGAGGEGSGFELTLVPSPAALRYELLPISPAQDMILVHEDEPDGGLRLRWCVNAALYGKETALAWMEGLAGWARYLADTRRRPGSPAPALLPEEEVFLSGLEQGPARIHPAQSFPALFEEWARLQPERPALIKESGEVSYLALDARANALAHALVARGVARQEPVGVLTRRSERLPETVLGIWKAGGCYLPLVTELPAERLAFIARHAGVRVLVALDGNEVPASLAAIGCQVFRPESLPPRFVRTHGHPVRLEGDGIGGEDLGCILHTSGSTGEPKGVMLRHLGLLNLGLGVAAALGIRSDDRALQMASPAFDLWISDLLTTWSAGAALVPALRGELEDIAGLLAKLARLKVSVATMTPSYLRLLERADLSGLRVLATVGEPPHLPDVQHYAARLRYFNGYGPTENTAAVSFGLLGADADRATAGRPLPNTSVHIVNGEGGPVPPGAVGEVWLGGMGLAAGYLNRPDLTAAAFVETPFGRRYRTGDLGRWTPSGELQVLGRSDGQVKLGGQRVELAEIELKLAAHPAVMQGVAAVETRADGGQTLWGFVCLRAGAEEPTQADLQAHLSATLPSYMVPSRVVTVAVIPVSLTGKVDRSELLRAVAGEETGAVGADDGQGREERAPPQDPTERRVAEVWAEHLGRGSIGREDSFFDLGGDSLRVIAVVNQLRRDFQCTVNDLYEHPRLWEFARTCRRRPDHLRTQLGSAARDWQGYRRGLLAYEAEREEALGAAWRGYEERNRRYRGGRAGERRDYRRVLLTGATGYLGSYLLRELLLDQDRQVSVLVRGRDDRSARARLGDVLLRYFGPEEGTRLRDEPRLKVLAGDLRRDDLGLPGRSRERLADEVQAVFHCAANVKHFGHRWEFEADNVAATERLLRLSRHRAASPADFHHVSTLSACGEAPEEGFRLFTEYDPVPERLDENYYLCTKQLAEQRVVDARRYLANACIHRVGNVVFAAEGGALQANLEENAFFRLVAAFLRLGVVPDDSHLWRCHVDLVARGLLLLAGSADLNNETHHLENARREDLADFLGGVDGVRACGFDQFLARLEEAVGVPELAPALAEVMEKLDLYGGRAPQARARRLEIVSDRTQAFLAERGLEWPKTPATGQEEFLRQAAGLFARPQSPAPSQGTHSLMASSLGAGGEASW